MNTRRPLLLKTVAVDRFLCAVFLISLVFTVPVQASPGWSWTITYQLDKSQYEPGSSGSVSVSMVNTGDVRLQIKEVGIQFDWQSSDRWWSQSTNTLLNLGQSASLGSVQFDVPAGTTEGKHQFRLGVRQMHSEAYYDPFTGIIYTRWVDDGVKFASDYDEIEIAVPKAVLTYVSVSGLPPLGRPIYVSETSVTIAVIANSGNAKAKSVGVVLEDMSPSTGLTVTSSDPPKDIDPLGTAEWKILIRGDAPGKYKGMLRVYSENERILEHDWELEVLAPEIAIVSRELSPQADQISVGDTFTITYTLRNTSPVDVNDMKIEVQTSGGLSVLDVPAITVIQSQTDLKVAVKLSANTPGDASISIVIMAYNVAVQQDNVSINITERPLWEETWFLGVIGIAVVVVLGVVVLLRRGGQKTSALSPAQQKPMAEVGNACPKCGKPLTFVQAYSRWYCTRCKEYV